MLPFLERVNVAPFLSNPASVHDLLHQSEGERYVASEVCRLTRVVGEELSEVQ